MSNQATSGACRSVWWQLPRWRHLPSSCGRAKVQSRRCCRLPSTPLSTPSSLVRSTLQVWILIALPVIFSYTVHTQALSCAQWHVADANTMCHGVTRCKSDSHASQRWGLSVSQASLEAQNTCFYIMQGLGRSQSLFNSAPCATHPA